ncbi:MAG: hypothetical protein KF751_10545 [Nitrospira sp.]|nr:hypothetical protein [Nitrospira sp.]
MRTVFTLASGRSGTSFLCGLLQINARGCVVTHEPYLDWGNPTMFGLPIYDCTMGHRGSVEALLDKKAGCIERYKPRVYIETSHAFLKSYWDLAPRWFPDMSVVHLVRNPLQVARSEANREQLIERWRLPFRHYRGRDGQKYFRWSLTGLEPIFGCFHSKNLTRFQWYLIQWIEIENRAIQFLDRFGKRPRCFTLHSPMDLNHQGRIGELLRFLGLEPQTTIPVIAGNRNRTPARKTVVGSIEEKECREVIEGIPNQFLRIFQDSPYSSCEWVRHLRKE